MLKQDGRQSNLNKLHWSLEKMKVFVLYIFNLIILYTTIIISIDACPPTWPPTSADAPRRMPTNMAADLRGCTDARLAVCRYVCPPHHSPNRSWPTPSFTHPVMDPSSSCATSIIDPHQSFTHHSHGPRIHHVSLTQSWTPHIIHYIPSVSSMTPRNAFSLTGRSWTTSTLDFHSPCFS